MKHTYITILCLLSAATFSFAQKKPLTIPVQNFPEHHMESVQTGNGILPDVSAQPGNVERTSNNSVRGGSPALWQEDFGGGFPNGWGIDDVTGLNPWKWTTNGSHGYFNGNNNGGGYADPINSTTAGNGFLICDNDSANHFNYGQPSGTTYQYLESYFVTNQIDLGASYSSLLLEFEQSFRFNNSVDMVVQVSADSVNWTSYNVQGGVDNNTASDDPDLVSVNISAAVGASQFVYLKIGWNARVYYWMIDDMKIVEGLDNDLELTKAYHGDVVNDFVYSKIPLEQASEMVVGAAVTNLGGLTQTNVTVDYEILRGGTSVASGSFTFLNDIVAADTDTAWHATNYTPDQTGDYEVIMTVSADNTDENLDNQSNSSNMEVTEFVFAHDYDESFELQVWGRDDDNGSANAYGHGSVYIPYNSGSSIYAIQAAFGSNTTTGTSIIAEVHELGSSIQDIVDSYITVFDLVPGNVNGGSGFFFTTIVLDEEVPLNAGTGYTIALQSDGGDDQLWLLSNSGNEDNSTTLYGPYGTGGATNWYNGWNHTPGLRMNLNPNIAGVDEDIEKLGFGMYPNPAAKTVSFLFASESDINSITITDMNGKLVSRLAVNSSNGSKLDVDVSNLSSGVYLVSTVGTQTISSNKLIIQH